MRAISPRAMRVGAALVTTGICFAPAGFSRGLLASGAGAIAAELASCGGSRSWAHLIWFGAANAAICVALQQVCMPLECAAAVAWVLNSLLALIALRDAGEEANAFILAIPMGATLGTTAMSICAPGAWIQGGELFLILIAVGTQDSLAMLIGRTWPIGRLARGVSPHKTWSGSLGGGAVAAALLVVTSAALGVSVSWGIALGVLAAAQAGDLFYSCIKRLFGVKDYSAALGEKGGVLDLADSMIFAVLSLRIIGSAGSFCI